MKFKLFKGEDKVLGLACNIWEIGSYVWPDFKLGVVWFDAHFYKKHKRLTNSDQILLNYVTY